jgi:hypothetical protein
MIRLTAVNSETSGKTLRLAGQFVVEMTMPEQGPKLPHQLERTTLVEGQDFMKEIFRLSVECADRELVLSERSGKAGQGIQLMGKRRTTFKTRFGSVVVPRIRIKHKYDQSTEIPSHRKWATPKQIMICAGLKEAVCDLAAKVSYGNTLRQLERETGEVGILSKSSICNILHEAGAQLQEAQQKRASIVYEQDNTAKVVLGRAESYVAESFFEDVYMQGKELTEENVAEMFEEIDWDARLEMEVALDNPLIDVTTNRFTEGVINSEVDLPAITSPSAKAINEAQILLQADEVVVASQEKAGGKYLLSYNAVVNSQEQKYYFSAPSAARLFHDVGGLLASLGVHQEGKQLVLISDCADWIRFWYDGAAIREKVSILCWWHLKKKCRGLIGEAIGNLEQRDAMKEKIMKLLLRGEVTEVCEYLTEVMTDWEDEVCQIEIKAIDKLIKLKEYLQSRQAHIPNYLARVKAGEWIASTQVEKLNDFAVSQRCKKKNGMRWKRVGVGAIAALEVARRNGELTQWREQGKLPQWSELVAIAA